MITFMDFIVESKGMDHIKKNLNRPFKDPQASKEHQEMSTHHATYAKAHEEAMKHTPEKSPAWYDHKHESEKHWDACYRHTIAANHAGSGSDRYPESHKKAQFASSITSKPTKDE